MSKQRTTKPRKSGPATPDPKPKAPRPAGKSRSKAARTKQATQCAGALRALADDFQKAAQRQRDLSAPSSAYPEIMDIMTWQEHAGGVVVEAHRAGLLDLPGLKELVAWLDGGELPRLAPDMLDNVPESEYTQRVNVLPKGEILRCTSNLWLSLVGRADVPAKHVRGELRFAPVRVGGLLADDPRMRPDRLFKHSVEARGADATQYSRLVKAADIDCSAAACRILAEEIERASSAARQSNRNIGRSVNTDFLSVQEVADVCGKSKGTTPSNVVDTPVTLAEFMKLFCTPLTLNLRDSRIKSLQSAARRGELSLPPVVGKWRSGQNKKYRPTALFEAWPEYLELLGLPELKPIRL